MPDIEYYSEEYSVCGYKEINAWEFERDDLKGIARFIKKGELQSRIDHKNEEIDILKIGLSGIVKQHGFHTVHEFYKTYYSAKDAYIYYQDKADNWGKIMGTMHKSRRRKVYMSNCRIIRRKE